MNFATVSTIVAIVLSVAGVYFAWKQVQIARSTRTGQEDAALGESPDSSSSTLKRRTDVLADIRENGVLRVGCLWYPPFIEFTQQGEKVVAKGLYPTMLDHVASQNGLHVEYQILRWDIAIEAINRRQVDVVACVLQSGKRRESCDFCGSLYRVGVGGVVRADQEKIKRHEDLTNPELRIAVTKGEIGWEYAERYLNPKQGLFRFTVVADTEITRMMNLVVSRDVDIALADSLSCAQYIEHARAEGNNLLDIFASFPLHVEENSLMIAKDQDDFRCWLSEGLYLARSMPGVIAMEEQISKQWPCVLIKVPTDGRAPCPPTSVVASRNSNA
jgi:ABC-type amino acid transport substrate-binding protein